MKIKCKNNNYKNPLRLKGLGYAEISFWGIVKKNWHL